MIVQKISFQWIPLRKSKNKKIKKSISREFDNEENLALDVLDFCAYLLRIDYYFSQFVVPRNK